MSNLRPLPNERLVAASTSQATQVEQARAVAEVQAAVTVAQQVPRNPEQAYDEMRAACQSPALANQAFYEVPNRGTGPTVHLARELARIWGNVDYGVRELRRDDNAGESEIQAYSWDQQKNVRSTRSFIVPHERMARKQRQKLIDLGDIYLNNQNQGARAVRECIMTTLPAAFVQEAQDLCKQTLEAPTEKPVEQRAYDMLGAFGRFQVTQQHIESKLGKPFNQINSTDLRDLAIVYETLNRNEATIDQLFPNTDQVSVTELTGGDAI